MAISWRFSGGGSIVTRATAGEFSCNIVRWTARRAAIQSRIARRVRSIAMTTFVMIHGAYQGGWIWRPVVTRLRAAGHVAYAPTLDGCAERRHQVRRGITVATHAQEIADFLFYEDVRDVVLVGTSSGGMVIVKAAELARERIARLSFLDALALLPGERVDAITNRATPREVSD